MAESFLSGKREVWEERRKKTQSGARAEVFSRHVSIKVSIKIFRDP